MASSPYTDLDRPPLAARALQRALVVPGGFWRRIEVLAETGSTNADVADAARAGAGEGLVVVAEQQVAGRGRRDRQWVSPPRAGLTLSVLLRPGVAEPGQGWAPAPQRTWGWLPLLAGVALLDTVQRLAEVDAALKWPNDLLLNTGRDDARPAGRDDARPAGRDDARPAGRDDARPAGRDDARPAGRDDARPAGPDDARAAGLGDAGTAGRDDSGTAGRGEAGTAGPGYAKGAGILAEVVGEAVVLGIGLNVTTRPEELPATTGLPATSLQAVGAKATDRDPLLRALLRGIAQWYSGWRDAGGDAEMCGLLAAYQRGCSTIGREVRVLLPNGAELAGVATTVDGDGQLALLTADGTERRVSAGDVLHVR